MRRSARRAAFVLATVASIALVVVFQLTAIHRQSLSGDGAYHLIAGHHALRYGQNTLNLEHPPLAKMVMAAPLLLEAEPLLPPISVDQALAATETIHGDADRLRRATVRGRYLCLVFFVLPLFVTCFAWGWRMTGRRRVGLLLVLMLGLSFNVVPNLTLLQTDAAVTLAFMLVFLVATSTGWRLGRPASAVAMGLACGVAVSVKFSGVLAAPSVLVALLSAYRAHRSWRRSVVNAVVIGVVGLLVLEFSYAVANWRYEPATGVETITRYTRNQATLVVEDRLAPFERPLLAVNGVDPRLAQWLTGFLGVRAQNTIGVYPSYAFGTVQSEGRWWYFPALLVIKTPLALLVLALALLALTRTRKRPDAPSPRLSVDRSDIAPAVTFVVTYLAVAITSNYNLGFRHLLPVLPVLYLPLAVSLTPRPRWQGWVIGVLALESLILTPLWMGATNTWWLGEHNPSRFVFSHGNLTYRQNFLTLAQAAQARGVHDLKVVYPLLGDAVIQAYLDDADILDLGDPLVPGWYAVSVFAEQMIPALLMAPPGTVYGQEGLVPLARAWWPIWRAVASGEDHGYVAGTFHLYHHETAPPVAP